MSLWADHVLPHLIERFCRSSAIRAERTRWIPRARGRVVEIGVGTGLNLPFYAPTRIESVTGLDPSAALLRLAAERARGLVVPVRLVEGRAEAAPLPDGAFDTAVLTYTLCSVDEPARVAAEIRRLLRPGGELIFLEHGLAPEPRTQRWQRLLTPGWRRLGGGCRLDRDPLAPLRQAGLDIGELTTGYVEGASWLSYTYEGLARRPG